MDDREDVFSGRVRVDVEHVHTPVHPRYGNRRMVIHQEAPLVPQVLLEGQLANTFYLWKGEEKHCRDRREKQPMLRHVGTIFYLLLLLLKFSGLEEPIPPLGMSKL